MFVALSDFMFIGLLIYFDLNAWTVKYTFNWIVV